MDEPAFQIIDGRDPHDIEAVRRLFISYAGDLNWDLSAGGRFAEEIENLPGPYTPPAGALLLARVGDRPAGVLGLQPVPAEARVPGIGAERFGELKRLFVCPDYRRLGIARGLMKRAEDEARARGYTALVLTTSAEMMPFAQGLYAALGYLPTEPYRDDLVFPNLLWLKLDL